MKRILLIALAAAVMPAPAQALETIGYGDLSSMTQDAVGSIVQNVALGTAFRSFASARPLGVAIGLDIGIEYDSFSTSDEFAAAMRLAGVTQTIPSRVPLPRLQIRKGFPAALDFGVSFLGYGGNRVLGFEGQWSWLNEESKGVFAAARLSYVTTKLFFLQTHAVKAELAASKRIGKIFDPYAGMGLVFGGGSLDVPSGGATGLPVSVSGSSQEFGLNLHLGLALDLVAFRASVLYETGFDKVQTLGAKVSLAL